jgi:DNA-binding response OmpR family regulator
VLIARDPARALERFNTQPFQGLIVDAGTTSYEGVDTFKQIMERSRKRDLACKGLLILSEDQDELIENIPIGEHCAVLVRPLRMGQLVEKIQRLLPWHLE